MSKTTIAKIERLKKSLDNSFIIHYACESLDPAAGRSPHIVSISLIGYRDETARTFSLAIEAEKLKIDFSEIRINIDKLERLMLVSFFRFVEENPEALFVHWNMSDVTFGFPAMYHRYNVLTKLEAPQVSERKQFNMAAVFKALYGQDYIDYPRMNNLATLNNYDSIDLFTGEEEARLIEDGEYVKASRSNIAKVKALRFILELFVDGKLKVKNAPEGTDKKKGFWQGLFG